MLLGDGKEPEMLEVPQSGPFDCFELELLARFFWLVFESVPRWLQGLLVGCY